MIYLVTKDSSIEASGGVIRYTYLLPSSNDLYVSKVLHTGDTFFILEINNDTISYVNENFSSCEIQNIYGKELILIYSLNHNCKALISSNALEICKEIK